MFLMLRASSLGLNLLPSSFHSVGRSATRWAIIRTSYSTLWKTTTQFLPSSIDVEGDLSLRSKQIHTKNGSLIHPVRSLVSSMSVRENSSNRLTTSPPMSAIKTAAELQLSELEPPKSIPSTGDVLGVCNTLEAPKSKTILQSPSYAAGRPWATENVQKVNLPKYILSPLRRLRIAAVKAHRLSIRVQNASKVTPPKATPSKKNENKNKNKKSLLPDDKKTQNAGKVTPSTTREQNTGNLTSSTKNPPLPEKGRNASKVTMTAPLLLYKEEQNAGKLACSMNNPPLPDKRQNAGKATLLTKNSPSQEDQNACRLTPSIKNLPLQDYNQAQDPSEVFTTSMKKLPLRDPVPVLIQHFEVIATTDSVDEGWNSYVFLVDLISGTPVIQRHIQHIPFAHLHRMARLLARNRPQTRRQFLRLLAVLTYLNYWGGKLKQHEWNALVAHAGSGWRKTKLEDFGNAMKVFNDMRAGKLPGSSDLSPPDREFLEGPAVQPDIYTYTSLLAIASRAKDSKNVYNVSSMLSMAGLPPNRITHLSLMRYFTLKGDLGGVRATLLKMRQQSLELGLDGLNACLWAYGRNTRVDIVMMIYRILRHNALPETYTRQNDTSDTIRRLGEEYIFVDPELHPNAVTLTTVIQVMAYHGHFTSALNVFMDMLSFNNMEKGAPLEEISAGVYEPTSYKPSLAVFRAIFLGFSRHAKHVQHDSDWTFDNLSQLFDLFLELPPDSNLTHNTVYLIMLAFDKASGRDIKMLRDVWMRMDRRFGIAFHKAHSVSRLARLRRLLFPEEEVIR